MVDWYTDPLPAIYVNAGLIHLQNKLETGFSTPQLPKMLQTSRQQFLASESRDGIVFERKGWYMSRLVCFLLALAAVLGAIIVGVATFYISREKFLFKSYTDMWTETESTTAAEALANYRLPTSVIPSFYRLKLLPNLGESIFNGKVYITLKTSDSDVKMIVLHSKGLIIQKPIKLTEQVYENTQNLRMKRGLPEQVYTNHSELITTNKTQTPTELRKWNETDKNYINHESDPNLSTENSKHVKTEIQGKYQRNESNASIDHPSHYDTGRNDTNQIKITKQNYTLATTGDVKLKKTQVTQSHTKNINITNFELDESTETLIIYLASTLKPNTDYTMEINFNGNITDTLNGLYKSTYFDSMKTKVLAITQFEPTHARAAFPCFDEPKFKAMFEISIAHSNNLTALSNMPIMETEIMLEKPGWSWTHYARSVNMSTYLVAYGIMDFDFLETTYHSKDNTTKTVRVWMRRELKEQGRYALSITPKLLMFYENLFDVPYALPKVDLIAIPDFSVGAMENWGLITFRETFLLLEKDGTVSQRQNIATSVSHELAHQWFGNLVTMSWWNDLWLNEGFATYVEYIGTNHVEPQWNMIEQLSHDKMELLRTDALQHTTTVSMSAGDASEIAQKFDEISYQKGASLIRMLNNTITETLFRKGLTAYLNKWKFSNAEENDLWSSMSQAVAVADPKVKELNGIDIVEFMNSWTHQAGYPVLTVKRHYNGSVTFTQALFTTATRKSESIWTIPITYTSVNAPRDTWSTTPKIWLKQRENTIALPLKNEETLYVNVDGIGYYRVNYDEENWKRITNTLKQNVSMLPPLTRAQLIDDAFNLAKVSLLPYETALNLTAFIKNEETRTVWDMLLSNVEFLKYTLRNTPHYSNFQDYMLRLLTPILNKHNYGIGKSTSDDATLLLERLLMWECTCEASRCVHWAQELFQQWMEKPDFRDNPIPSNVRRVVYSTAVQHGGRAEFDFLWRVFINSSDPNTADSALSALASTRDDALMRLLLERSLTEISAQNAASAWNLDCVAGGKLSQEFFIENWARIYEKFNKMDSFVFASVIGGAFRDISTQQELDRYKKFVEDHYEELRPHRRSLLKMADSALLRINWLRTHTSTVGYWLSRSLSGNINSNSTDVSTKTKKSVDVVKEGNFTIKETPSRVHPTNETNNFEKTIQDKDLKVAELTSKPSETPSNVSDV